MAESHKPSCGRSIQRRGHAEGWTEQQIAEAIRDHCAVSLLRGHRLARGWTLEGVAAELRSIYARVWGTDSVLSHQRVSRWENGADMPNPKYLDTLCRLHRTRPDLLGFGNDYSHEPERAGAPSTALHTGDDPELPARQRRPATGIGGGERGRHVWIGRLLDSGAREDETSLPLLKALKTVRARADTLLETQSVCAATVDRWESLVEDYGYRQLTTPLDVFLAEAVHDFAELQDILQQRQPLEFQQRLYRVTAQLAGLIGFDLMGIGALGESHAWYHTARLAANEIGDRALRAWLDACESLSYFWDIPLVGRAVSLCQAAQVMAGSTPTAAGAFAASIQARAFARLGRRNEAIAAIRLAEAIYERLDPAETNGTRLGFSERRLRYDQQNALTRLGETKAAMEVQEHALRLPCGDSIIESTMIKLDLAGCLISENELDEGCRIARRALIEVPAGFETGVISLRAQEIAAISRARDSQLGSVRDLHEIVLSSKRRRD